MQRWLSRPAISVSLRVRWVQLIGGRLLLVYGSLLAVEADAYTSPVYHYCFRLVPPEAWGLAMATVGFLTVAATLRTPHVKDRWTDVARALASGSAVFLMITWSGLLFAAAIDPNLDAGTLGGPLAWVAAAAMHLSSVLHFGNQPRRGAEP